MVKRQTLAIAAIFLLLPAFGCEAKCLSTKGIDPDIQFRADVKTMLASHGLTTDDIFRAMHETSAFETNGCWGGASNPDGQLLSVGIMQWNLGKMSLQSMLRDYVAHFKYDSYRDVYTKKLMQNYGESFFKNCLSDAVTSACKDLIFVRWKDIDEDENPKLKPDFAAELDQLFNDPVMRQIQMDEYTKDFTAAVDDFKALYHNNKPAYWQEAWAIDIRTQLGHRVLTDNAIKVITNAAKKHPSDAFTYLITWYTGKCIDPTQHKNPLDCDRNEKIWPQQKTRLIGSDIERLITLGYTMRLAETTDIVKDKSDKNLIKDGSGEWILDAFTRKATIAMGVGSVHGTMINDLTPP
jgi:hypothetical protein